MGIENYHLTPTIEVDDSGRSLQWILKLVGGGLRRRWYWHDFGILISYKEEMVK